MRRGERKASALLARRGEDAGDSIEAAKLYARSTLRSKASRCRMATRSAVEGVSGARGADRRVRRDVFALDSSVATMHA